MSVIGSNILAGASGQGGGYNLTRSLRFRSSASAYLNRTFGSGNRQIWTLSFWFKRGASLADNYIFEGYTNDTNRTFIRFASDTLIYAQDGSTNVLQTTQVFRDPSAWYHIVLAVDTTQATASNRAKLYVNGVQVTAFTTANYQAQNTNTWVNAATTHNIMRSSFSGGYGYTDGYMTEINFIDGQALTPSSFGETDPITGVWRPKKYTGTYGTNGFYLNFSDNSGTTSTTLGKDYSGNGNNWTPNNFSVTAGAGNDSLVDVPTRWGSDSGLGAEVRGNYATLNPLAKDADVTLANGNLDFSCTTAALGGAIGTIAVSSGKWYWEVTPTGGALASAIGVAKLPLSAYDANQTGTYLYLNGGSKRLSPSTDSSYGASYTDNDVIGVALDMDAGTVVFYKNGVSQGTAFSSLSGDFTAWMQDGSASYASTFVTNFGQRPFAYTAPSGFKALCTTNLPEPSIKQGDDYFNAVLWTGTGATQSISTGHATDFAWIKSRSTANSHRLFDIVRGATKTLSSNDTAAEATESDSLTAFGSDGFTLGADTAGGGVNISTRSYVGWSWKANGTGVTNTAGSITSTVSANTTSGFSIVTWTGNGSTGTVGHGLGVAPKMIITKERSASGNSWPVWFSGVTSATQYLYLNGTNAIQTSTNYWNSTLPTSTVFSVGNDSATNGTGTHVAYCFAEIAGFSKFGSYTGNGSSDGPFVYCGFRPKFVMIKSTAGDNWTIVDTSRNTYNVADARLFPSSSTAEATGTANCDILSNGFKIRIGSTDTGANGNGTTYIYAAFAENPYKYSLAR